MAFPVTFAGLTTAQMASLDQMFQIVGNIGAIPCTAAGTNLITLTPSAGITPAVNTYANYLQFSFVASSTSTGPVSLQVGSLGALPVYLPTGTQAGSGGLAGNALYVIAFNQNLNSGGGGWQIIAGPTIAVNAALTTGRNRMINGGQDIDQRNEGAVVTINNQSITAGNQFIADQTLCFFSGLATNVTAQRVAVTGLAGFTYGTQVTIGSAGASVGLQDYLHLTQHAEGINVADLGFGTAVAQPVSTGVWINSSVGGQVGISLRNSAGTRSYVSITNTTAGVWTFCPVANIPGDTVGTWLAGAGQIGINYSIALMAGTGRQTASANTWTTTNNIATSGQTNITTTGGATFIVTGLSLEPGAVTNTFDRRPYPTEVGLCQRYYEKSYDIGTAVGNAGSIGAFYMLYTYNGTAGANSFGGFVAHKVAKNTDPTVSFYAPITGHLSVGTNYDTTADVSIVLPLTPGETGFPWEASITSNQVNFGFHWTSEAGL